MSEPLNIAAGVSTELLTLGGAQFGYDPVSINEYIRYLQRPQRAEPTVEAQVFNLQSQAEWLAGVLRHRIIGTTLDPVSVTTEWVTGNCPARDLGDIITTYLTGEKPKTDGEKKGP